MKKNIYALIVGIDDYPSCPLNGCVADTQKMIDYLKSDLVSNHYTIDFEILNDGDAKRMNIIEAFQKHLGKAGKDDIALFYFSGHGAQEIADQTIWHGEGNRKLEGLVCHDSLSTSLLLADKELRFLINSISENDAHILTIFDCCHSGGNTRGFVETEMTKRQFADPRMGQEFPKRAWNQFFFNEKIDIERLKSKPLNEVMPQGNHIQLAACQSDQSAYETNIQNWGKGGVFTYNLIQVLNRSKGMVSYYDLKSRIFHFIKNQYNQTPVIYVKGSKRGNIYKNFLGGEAASVPLYGNLVFNEKQQNWVLDMGAIHGISEQAETVNVEVAEQQTIAAEIIKVNTADTILKLPEDAVLDTKKAYKAYVHPFKSAPIGVFINGDAYEQQAKDELVDLIAKNGSNINLVAAEKTADYTIQLDKWHYSITLPNDPYRPLVLPVEQLGDDAVQDVFNQLYHISQWEFAKELHNSDPDPKTHLNASAIRVDMTRVDNEERVTIDNDDINMYLSTVAEDGEINIRLTNTTNRKLYVAALYMGVNFEVLPDFLEAGVQMLEPNGFVDLMVEGDVNIPYYLDDCKRLFNWKKSTSYFKIIINTQSFDVNNLLLNPLEDPSELFEEKMRGAGKGIGRRTKSAANAEQWTTRLLSFNVHNPNYNCIDLKELKSYLQTAAAPFVAGLYLEQPADLSGELSVKDKIKIAGRKNGMTVDGCMK